MRLGFQIWTPLAWSHQVLSHRPLQNHEKELIETALAQSKGKVAGLNGAAAKLGIPRSTLDLRIKTTQHKETHLPVSPLVETARILAIPKILSLRFLFTALFFTEIHLGTRLHCCSAARSRLHRDEPQPRLENSVMSHERISATDRKGACAGSIGAPSGLG